MLFRRLPACPLSLSFLGCCLLPIACCLLGGCKQVALAPEPPTSPPPTTYQRTAPSGIMQAQAIIATPLEARVQEVGKKLFAANPQIHTRPKLVVQRTDAVELSHTRDDRILVSEGFVNACPTDPQLAAALSWEIAKWVSERQAEAEAMRLQTTREPPPDVPIGRDSMTFGDADQIHKAELAKLGFDRRKVKEPPPPDPNELARQYLRRAGYAETELDGVRGMAPAGK